METSGLPYFTQVKIIQVTVAIAGAMVVVAKMEASCGPVGCSRAVETVPAKPEDEAAEGTDDNVMSRDARSWRCRPCLYLPRRGPSIAGTDQCAEAANHMDGRRNLRNHGSPSEPASRRPRPSVLQSDIPLQKSRRSKYSRIRSWYVLPWLRKRWLRLVAQNTRLNTKVRPVEICVICDDAESSGFR